MFRRQLAALGYPLPEEIDIIDRSHFAKIILWLEDQKIRHYKIEDRDALRKIGKADATDWLAAWEEAFAEFKRDLNMPTTLATPNEELSWLVGHAVKLEFIDNVDSYADITAHNIVQQQSNTAQPTIHSNDPLDLLDQSTVEFRDGIAQLAKQLLIPEHPDVTIRLQAVASLIDQKLRPDQLNGKPPQGMAFPIKEGSRCAFDDADVDQAAKILRLLQIQHIRSLQTEINESIVAVQELTSNPKTDSKLGRVGMK